MPDFRGQVCQLPFESMKFSPEIIKEICTAIREGSSQKDAATLAGISEETFHQWKRNKPEFSEPLLKAELECKNRNIKIIQKAAITTWQAGAWWLERRYFMEYGLKHQMDSDQFADVLKTLSGKYANGTTDKRTD